MTGRNRRLLGRTRAVAGVLRAGLVVPLWLSREPGSESARRLERRFFEHVRNGFGVSVEVRGEIAPADGTLFVANHISWADIVVLGSVLDAHFVSKAEVADWPLIGPLARRQGPVFIDRGRRRHVSGQADAIRERLAAGGSVILFPEGTTADGRDLLPFRTSLFAAADAARRIQPIALTYAAPDGSALPLDRLAEIAWVGDEGLLPNARALARAASRAIICPAAPVDPRAFPDRKTMADHVREAIRAACGVPPGAG